MNDRTPVILPADRIDAWLDPAVRGLMNRAAAISGLVLPCPSSRSTSSSRSVNPNARSVGGSSRCIVSVGASRSIRARRARSWIAVISGHIFHRETRRCGQHARGGSPAAMGRGQYGLGLSPARVPGAVPVVQGLPPLHGDAPRVRVVRSGHAAPFGIPGSARGRDDGHPRMVGERHTAFLPHRTGQVVGRGQRRPDRHVVAAGSAPLGQVSARAHP